MGVPFSMVPNSEDILTFLNCPLIWEYFISEFTLIATSFKFGTRDQKYFAAENWKTTFLTYIGSKYKLIGPFFLTRLLQQYSWRWTRALAPHLQFTTKFMAHNITFFQTQSSYCLKYFMHFIKWLRFGAFWNDDAPIFMLQPNRDGFGLWIPKSRASQLG